MQSESAGVTLSCTVTSALQQGLYGNPGARSAFIASTLIIFGLVVASALSTEGLSPMKGND
jgi:hypothetical protein